MITEKLQIANEGRVKLLIPKDSNAKRKDIVFYNPEAKLSRDLISLVCRVLTPKKIIDMNAGTGAMSLKIAKEIDTKIDAYDVNEYAVEIAKKNVRLNTLENNINIFYKDSMEINFNNADMIIIDPLGSPAPFFVEVIKNVKEDTIISMKATDLGTLSGKYPNKAEKTYKNRIYRNPCPRETAIRTLLLYAEKESNKYNKSIKPLFSYATNYYVHIIFKLIKKERADTKWICLCDCINNSVGEKKEYCECGRKMICTEIYAKNKSDIKFIEEMRKQNNLGKEIDKELDKAKNQTLLKRVYNIPKLCKKLKIKVPKFDTFREKGTSLSYDKDTFTTNYKGSKLFDDNEYSV